MSVPNEFAIDATWAAIQTLLSAQLGDDVDVDCIGEQDFDEDGDLSIRPPAARVLFVEERAGQPFDPQNATYNAEQAFGVICAAEDLSGVQSQRAASAQLTDQVKHLLTGARLTLPDGTQTAPMIYVGTKPLPTSAIGMAYVAEFIVPNIAQFAAPNAQFGGI